MKTGFRFSLKAWAKRHSENCNFKFHLNPLLGVFVPEIVDHHIATSGVGLGQWHLQLNVLAEKSEGFFMSTQIFSFVNELNGFNVNSRTYKARENETDFYMSPSSPVADKTFSQEQQHRGAY